MPSERENFCFSAMSIPNKLAQKQKKPGRKNSPASEEEVASPFFIRLDEIRIGRGSNESEQAPPSPGLDEGSPQPLTQPGQTVGDLHPFRLVFSDAKKIAAPQNRAN